MTVDRALLQEWVVDALRDLGGSGRIVDVLKTVWKHHQREIEGSGDMFYTWQYDIRWAAMSLRKSGRLRSATDTERGSWELARKS